MKIGIIIIFHNNEKNINRELFSEQINKTQNIKLCMVNNCSDDKTFQILKEIKEKCESKVSIVDIKKNVSESSAKRAGARYMFNQFELNHIGYINTNSIDFKKDDLYNLIKNICDNKKEILEYNIEILKEKEVKQTMFQSLFSVIEYLKNIKSKSRFSNIEYKF
jgi:hypothetical protein